LSADLKEFAENLRPTSYFVFDSTKTDPAVMRNIEALLWDTESGIKDAEQFLAAVFQLLQGDAEDDGSTGETEGTPDATEQADKEIDAHAQLAFALRRRGL